MIQHPGVNYNLKEKIPVNFLYNQKKSSEEGNDSSNLNAKLETTIQLIKEQQSQIEELSKRQRELLSEVTQLTKKRGYSDVDGVGNVAQKYVTVPPAINTCIDLTEDESPSCVNGDEIYYEYLYAYSNHEEYRNAQKEYEKHLKYNKNWKRLSDYQVLERVGLIRNLFDFCISVIKERKGEGLPVYQNSYLDMIYEQASQTWLKKPKYEIRRLHLVAGVFYRLTGDGKKESTCLELADRILQNIILEGKKTLETGIMKLTDELYPNLWVTEGMAANGLEVDCCNQSMTGLIPEDDIYLPQQEELDPFEPECTVFGPFRNEIVLEQPEVENESFHLSPFFDFSELDPIEEPPEKKQKTWL